MQRLKIGPRLNLAFGIVFVLTIAGYLLVLWQFNNLVAQSQSLQDADDQVAALAAVSQTVLNIDSRVQRAADARQSDAFAADLTNLQSELDANFGTAIRLLRASTFTPVNPTGTAQQLAGYQQQLSATLTELRTLALAEDWDAVDQVIDTRLFTNTDAALALSRGAQQSLNFLRLRTFERMVATRNTATAIAVFAALATAAAAAILAVQVSQGITRSLQRVAEGAEALGRGEFGYQIKVPGDDELVQIADAFNTATLQLADLYHRMEERVAHRTAELERRLVQVQTNTEVSQQINAILDRTELSASVAEIVRERYDLGFVGIYIYERGLEMARLIAGTGSAGKQLLAAHHMLPIDETTIPGWAMSQKYPALVLDVLNDSRHQPLEGLPNSRTQLTLPLMVGTRLLGALDIHSDTPDAITWDDVPVFEALAVQIAIALRNSELYAGEQSRRTLAEKLVSIGRALTGTLEVQHVQDLILNQMSDLVHFDRGSVLLLEDNQLRIIASVGFPAEVEVLDIYIDVAEDDLFDQIIKTGEPLLVPDVSSRADWQQIAGLAPARAWLGIPLQHSGRTIGVLALTREVPQPFAEVELTLASAFAAQAAAALENARLYERMVNFNLALESEVEHRTEDLQRAFDQLERLDRSKTDFINVASHELRTPLTLIKGYGQMLRTDRTIQKSAPQLELVNGINTGAERMQEVINSMLDVARITNQMLNLSTGDVNLNAVINGLKNRLGPALRERRQNFLVDPSLASLPNIEGDPDLLLKVFSHLLNNAVKFTPDGGRITVIGRQRPAWQSPLGVESVEVAVRDTGIGVDPTFKDLIFHKFYQPSESLNHTSSNVAFKGGGPGLGLAIVQGVVTAHHGRVWVESPGYDEINFPGSTFYVLLPVRPQSLAANPHTSTPALTEPA